MKWQVNYYRRLRKPLQIHLGVTLRCLDLFEDLFSLLALKKTIGEFLSAIRSSHRRCSIWKHLCCSLFFNKVTNLRPATSLKKKLQRRCFPVNIAKILRAILKNISGRLLLSRILLVDRNPRGYNTLAGTSFCET